MTPSRSLMSGSVVLLLALSVLALSAPALAKGSEGGMSLACGTTITSSVTLKSDVGPCPGNGIVLGADEITLNCAGHSVTGTVSSEAGIGTQNNDVKVVNCNVSGFFVGFAVYQGTGDSFVSDSAQHNMQHGFLVLEGSNATFTNDEAVGNGGSGFAVTLGDGSTLTNDRATSNGVAGFAIYLSSRDSLVNDEADGNGQAGFGVTGSSNSLVNDRASGNLQHGFDFLLSFNNTLTHDEASGNNGDGFAFYLSANNAVHNSVAEHNAFGFLDLTSGGGTAGTRNFYTDNVCTGNLYGGSHPGGLCGAHGDDDH